MVDFKFRKGLLVVGGVALLLLSGCAESVEVVAEAGEDPAGFWKGLWHGIIIVISFIIGLFKDDVAIYAAHNTGTWYDIGFVLGILFMGGGAGRGSRHA